MKPLVDLIEYCHAMGKDGGLFYVPSPTDRHPLKVVASNGGGWDHVSVSRVSRCPNWPEMAYVKRLFFLPDETAMELHPPESEWINNHPRCLHLWRPQNEAIPRPPEWMVGIPGVNNVTPEGAKMLMAAIAGITAGVTP